LETGTLYYYLVGNGEEASEAFAFRTAPPVASPFTFAVYSDTRSTYDTHLTRHGQVADSILAHTAPAIVLLAGDVVEHGGWCLETAAFGWGPEYFLPGRELFARTPAFIAIGNHEYEPYGDVSNYQSYFSFPENGSADPADDDLWYSFDYGAAHFVMINSNYYSAGGNFAPGSAQYQWLESDLASSAAAWKFAVFHHPPYARSSYGRPPLEEYLVPLLRRYGVPVVFSGHVHFYERSRARGIHYLVTDGGGEPIYPPEDASLNPYSVLAAELYHHCRVEIAGDRLAFFAVETDGDVFDSFTLDLSGDEDADGYATGDEFRSGWDPSDLYSPAPRSFAAGDYDGDGTADLALFRPASGLWAVLGMTRIFFGRNGDWPVNSDFAGDGTARPGIFRPASGLWAVSGLTRFVFGASGDLPAPGDYSDEGIDRAGVFRPASGLWAVRDVTGFVFGRASDRPVPADYDGDGAAEAAFFRMSEGYWNVRETTSFHLGSRGDVPLALDIEGDGVLKPAVFRSSSGLWSVRGLTRFILGTYGDQPVPADYAGTAGDPAAIFRPSSGLWVIRDLSRAYFGSLDDVAVSR